MKPITYGEESRRIIDRRFDDLARLDPKIQIRLGCNDYTLQLTNWAAKELLAQKEVNLLTDPISNELRDPSFLGFLLYVALKHNHPEMTEEKVDALIDLRLYPYVVDRLRAALEMFLPDVSDLPEFKKAIEEVQEKVNPTSQLAGSGSDIGQ